MITTVAPAKINWTLEVLRKRDDGYHEVRTILQTIELHDELSFAPSDHAQLEVAGPYTPGSDDLILRAVQACDAKSRIRLNKRIPVGAGLGGGSSDAAATLRVLGSKVLPAPLLAAAASLGSDVPFFLRGGTALAQGRGETMTPLPDVPTAWLVLVIPPISIPDKTRTMYAALEAADFSDGSQTVALADHIRAGQPIEARHLRNVFERASFEVFDGLAKYREWMHAAGATSVHLAGAGPSLFALTSGEPEARAIRARMNRPKMGEKVLVVRTIPAAEATLTWES